MLLRRPPAVQAVAEPFLPPRADLEEVDRRWEALLRRNPRAFDGPALHVLGVHRNGCGGAVVHAVESSYRFYAVQDDTFDCGMRGLGVRAITRAGSRVLMGRRGPHSAHYPGLWEFVPGGALEPGADPAAMILLELGEETGLAPAAPPTPVAILFDPGARSWEIVYRIDACAEPAAAAGPEHTELRWFAPGSLPGDLSPVTRQMTRLL